MCMKRLFAIALAFLVCVAMTGCAIEKVATVSGPVARVADPPLVGPMMNEDDAEPEWNDDEVDAQIPEEYLTDESDEHLDWDVDWDDEEYDDEEYDDEDWDVEGWDDDEELDYGIPRTLTSAPDGTAVDGNPVDYVISDDLFSSQMDEISYYSDGYLGKSFAVVGYVMLPDDLEDEHGFAVVRDYQEPHSDDEDYEDDGEYMTEEEFAALIASFGEDADWSEEGDEEGDDEEGDVPAEPSEPDATPAPVAEAGIVVEPGETVSLGDLGTPLPELSAQIADQADPDDDDDDDDDEDAADEDGEDDADDWDDEDEHVHEIYPVGIDCYFEGEIPQADAWVRVVGTLEEYDYFDAEADESFPALRLRVQSVTPIPETEGGSRLVTQ